MANFKKLITLIASVGFIFSCNSQQSSSSAAGQVSIIPEPKSIVMGEGNFLLNKNTQLIIGRGTNDVAAFIKAEMEESSKIYFNGKGNRIQLVLSDTVSHDEGYKLNITESEITITGKTPAGVFYGYQSLKQLFPNDFFKKNGSATSMEVPCLYIEDEPDLKWRGLHLDVCRYFHSVADVKKYLDIMALHKLNTFHFHLTDDQGWRIEIKKYPKLTSVGSIRSETMKGHFFHNLGYDGKPVGGFYTQEQAKDIVAYAAKRYITVVPEIELPGHAVAAIASYPELGNTDQKLEVHKTWGVITNVFNVKDSTINFLKDVFDEIMAIFPSKYIHVGGDECPKDEWKKSADAQARIKKEGLRDENHLQTWFIEQFDKHMAKNGRKIIGWDEILEGGLTEGATIMSWRGAQGGIAAAKLGHDVVMTPNSHVYLDYYQTRGYEPLAIGGYCPIEKIYKWDPRSNIPEEFKKHVIGFQGNVWCEYIKNIEQAIYMAWPRACAIAESGWCTLEAKNYNRFSAKLPNHLVRLALAGFEVKFDEKNRVIKDYTLESNVAYLRVPLPASPNGLYQLFFTKNGGDPVEISSAELLIDEATKDKEVHYGYSGAFDQGSMYTLSAGRPIAAGEAVAKIKIKTENRKNAKGKIVITMM